jgi:hypothetical protein
MGVLVSDRGTWHSHCSAERRPMVASTTEKAARCRAKGSMPVLLVFKMSDTISDTL